MALTILVVDDSKLARIVAGKTIAALQPNWVRVEAGNAEDALKIINERVIDIALVDFNMPGMDGLQLAAELRASRPTMPIAIITANVQDEVVARARTINAAFVTKPLTEDGLAGFLSGAALRIKQTVNDRG